MRPRVVVVCGPTASGKTALGIALAKRLGGEVVSADSMQVYRGMDIGTAKPTKEEMDGVHHHMLDVASLKENYSVARYVAEASRCVDDILRRGKIPLVVGGTGLYIDALLQGQKFAEGVPESAVRERLRKRAAEEGIAGLWTELQVVDPESAKRLHPNDTKRIIRALEVFHETGKSISEHNRESRHRPPRYESLTIGLDFQEREELRKGIDRRVEEMVSRGLLSEVERLIGAGIPKNSTAMQAIGYKELVSAFETGIPVSEAVEEIKLRTKQYAKRQRSWFRRNASVHWILWEKTVDFSLALQDSISFFLSKGLG